MFEHMNKCSNWIANYLSWFMPFSFPFFQHSSVHLFIFSTCQNDICDIVNKCKVFFSKCSKLYQIDFNRFDFGANDTTLRPSHNL